MQDFGDTAADREIDARGLSCPLPVLRTKRALNDMQTGEVIRVRATDPGSMRDFEAFSRQSGHQLLSAAKADDEFVFLLRKKK